MAKWAFPVDFDFQKLLEEVFRQCIDIPEYEDCLWAISLSFEWEIFFFCARPGPQYFYQNRVGDPLPAPNPKMEMSLPLSDIQRQDWDTRYKNLYQKAVEVDEQFPGFGAVKQVAGMRSLYQAVAESFSKTKIVENNEAKMANFGSQFFGKEEKEKGSSDEMPEDDIFEGG